MAVSSSIGSNIFDVLVGLPLPWAVFCLVKQKSVTVGTSALGFSIMVLLLMLISVVTIIKCNSWRLTKSLGYAMLILYVLFVIQYLMQEFPVDNPIFVAPF